jgi:hypothetical protein
MPYIPAEDAVGLSPDSRQATHCWNEDGAPPPVLVTVLELPVLELPVLELPVLELPVLELAVPELVVLELVAVPSLAAGCDAAVDPSSGVAGADVAADTDGPGMGVTPERPSGTCTF